MRFSFSDIRKINGRNLLVFFCFVVVSSSLWVLNAMNERFETDIVVRVAVANIPEGVELEGQDDLGVDVYVRDRGSELLDYKLGNDPVVTVDFNELSDIGNGNLTMHFSALENRVSNALKSSSTFLHFKDDYLSLQVKRESVTLPVKLNYDIETKRHYELIAVDASVREITFVAPSSEIKEWEVLELPEFVIRGLDRDTLFTYHLPGGKYSAYDPSSIDVHLTVAPYVDCQLICPVNLVNRMFDLNLDDYYDIPDSVLVSYLAPASLAGGVSECDFRVELDFMELTGGMSDSIAFRLAKRPMSIEEADVKIVPGFVCRRK